MHIIVLHIIEDREVIMNIASSIEILWQEIKSNIIPVRWLDLISWGLDMSEVFSKWEFSDLGIKHGHLSLEEFILTSVVIGIFIGHSQSGSEQV
jgi:hypothetical protein